MKRLETGFDSLSPGEKPEHRPPGMVHFVDPRLRDVVSRTRSVLDTNRELARQLLAVVGSSEAAERKVGDILKSNYANWLLSILKTGSQWFENDPETFLLLADLGLRKGWHPLEELLHSERGTKEKFTETVRTLLAE